MGCKESELSIVIVDDPAILRLNREYLHRSRPTNVISFPMGPSDFFPSPRILGDVVISIEAAQRQARQRRGKLEDEILFLLIHGILHLLGYDHEGSLAEKAKMEAKEQELLGYCKKGKILP